MANKTSNGGGLCVVTGGAGFIGSHLVEALLGIGWRVRVLDNFSSGHRKNIAHVASHPGFELVEGDVADLAVAREAVRGATRVFHLAALADIVPSIQRPEEYYRSNVAGTFTILEAARSHGVSRFIYAASSSCYGIPVRYPTSENAPDDARYPYALTKLLGEKLALHWCSVYGLPVVSLRLFNVFGPRSRTTGAYGAVFGVFLAQLRAGKPLTVVGDGEQRRDFTFVSDVVAAFMAAADSDVAGAVYNVGTSNPPSVNELVKLLGSPPTVGIPKRPGEPDMTWAETTRIKEELGWAPKVSFSEGVKIMLSRIEDWRDAPVWTADSIAAATSDWFRYLSPGTKSD